MPVHLSAFSGTKLLLHCQVTAGKDNYKIKSLKAEHEEWDIRPGTASSPNSFKSDHTACITEALASEYWLLKLTSVEQFTIDTDLLWLLIVKYQTRQLYCINTNIFQHASTKLNLKNALCLVSVEYKSMGHC